MKTFVRSIGGLVVIALLVLIILFFLGWSRIPDILSGKISKSLKVLVEIGDMSLSPSSIGIDKLEIGNPPHYYLPRAFEAGHIVIDAPLTRYLSDHIEIDEIEVSNVYLSLEFDSPQGTEGNWTTIMKNAQAAQASSTQEKSTKSVLIHRLILTNIRTDLIYRNQGNKVRHLRTIDRIELKEISNTGGNVMEQIMNSALGEMIKEIFIEQNLKEALEKVLKPGKQNPIQNAIEQFIK
jgi:uncharacterized protein involved in outer membrane biogenesis